MGLGILSGAGTGATIGSMIPGIGTAAGAAIGGTLGLLGNLFGIGSRKRAEQRQFDREKELMGLQYEYGEKAANSNYERALNMWNATNYEAQVQHMKNAGLNVGLMYSGGGGMQASTSGGNNSGVSQSGTQSVAMGLQLKQIQQQMALNAAQIANVTADTEKKRAEAKNIDEGTANTIEQRKQILEATRSAKADADLKEFEVWKNDLKKNTTFYKNGKGKDYAEMYLSNVEKEMEKKGIELDAESAKLLNEKGIAERLATDLDKLASGEFAEATRKVNEAIKSGNQAERERWELEQDKALSQILDNTTGGGQYAKLLSNIIKYFFKR